MFFHKWLFFLNVSSSFMSEIQISEIQLSNVIDGTQAFYHNRKHFFPYRLLDKVGLLAPGYFQ